MRVAVINPIAYLQKSEPGPYYCYASLLLTSSVYYNFFARRGENTILDCSPALPRKADIDILNTGIKMVKPRYVVLPSVDYSSRRTVSLVKEFLRNNKSKFEPIGVIQGHDIDSTYQCYTEIRMISSILALPSPLEKIGGRDELIRDMGIKERVAYIDIYSNPFREIPPADSFGIFTSYPARLAIELRGLTEYKPTPKTLDFFTKKDDVIDDLLSRNISDYRDALSYEGSKVR